MSNPKLDWNPDDGPPPTDEELLAASQIANGLENGASLPGDPDAIALVSAALRVRAITHADPATSKATVDRVVRDVMARHARSWWTRAPRLRIAAAAAMVLAAGVGGGNYMLTRSSPGIAPALSSTAVFDAPVEPGAGSVPSSRLYDNRLRSYRAAMLGGAR